MMYAPMIKVESFTIRPASQISSESVEAVLKPVGGLTITELTDIEPSMEFMMVPTTYEAPVYTVMKAIDKMPSIDDEEKEYLKHELKGMIERYSE